MNYEGLSGVEVFKCFVALKLKTHRYKLIPAYSLAVLSVYSDKYLKIYESVSIKTR
jgi:hypothetical protein